MDKKQKIIEILCYEIPDCDWCINESCDYGSDGICFKLTLKGAAELASKILKAIGEEK